MKVLVVLFALVATFSQTYADECSSIKNEDKIDCLQNVPNWTVAMCLAKGCCHVEVPGFPACFLNHAYIHEAKCTSVGVSSRRDCGNAQTTEESCIESGCCWEMAPGAPYCYHPDPTISNTTPTSNPITETTSTPDVTTSTPDVTTSSPGDVTTSNPTDVTTGSTIDGEKWKGRGAKVAFVEVEAEHAHHTGQIIGNDRTYGKLSSEASQRRAVQLNAVGQYVEFTMPIQANSLVVRYSLPDSANGKGLDATIDLYVNNNKLKALPFTSRYSWYYGGYPFNNNPSDSNPHHFYDEVRTMLDKTYPQGTKVKLEVTSTSQSPTFTIDLADFELVGAPITKPANSLSVIDFHADPTGKTDSTAAFQQAVNAGSTQKKVVFIPQGTYLVYDHIVVDNVQLVGAGPWYSVLTGRHPTIRSKAVGVYGKYATENGGSKNVVLKDFAIIGDIQERIDDDQVNAIGGALSDSVVDNVWMQHTKCGAWMDGPMNNLKIINSRIIDTTADGVNFHKGVTNSSVQNTFIRNVGDDGLAMWGQDIANVNNKFIHNTIGLPILANNIAIYGGKDIEVSDNLIYDTITNGGGIHIANRYPGVMGDRAVSGTHTVFRNTLLRCGNSDFNWRFGVGAIWFSALNEELNRAKIHVKDCDIIDSSYAAIHYIEGKTFGVTFENVLINGTGTFALQLQAGGEATFINVKAMNIQQSNPIHNCVGTAFKFNIEGEKSSWYTDKPFCGEWPQPKWPWNW